MQNLIVGETFLVGRRLQLNGHGLVEEFVYLFPVGNGNYLGLNLSQFYLDASFREVQIKAYLKQIYSNQYRPAMFSKNLRGIFK